MKFGLFGGALSADGVSNDSRNYELFIDYVRQADALGFHSVFVVEHHFTGVGQVSATLNLLSYLAARTERIRLGTAVTVLPWHNPVLLAEQIATLDLLSGGRADIGVGKGYRPYEFLGFDIPMEEAAPRFEEGLDLVVRSLTSTERFSHSGKYWKFNDIVVEPASVQKPHPPIWVGAGSRASIETAAKKGMNLLLEQMVPAEVIIERMGIYRDAVVASGRKFAAGNVGVTRAVQVTRSEAERREAVAARARFIIDSGALNGILHAIGGGPRTPAENMEIATKMVEDAAIIGEPQAVAEKIKVLQAAGVEYVLLCDQDVSKDALSDFAREVMPHFRSDKAMAAE